MGTFNCPPSPRKWKSKAWKLFGVLIGWTKSVKWRGLNLCAMNVEKILWTMSNWDCTSIMCTQCGKILQTKDRLIQHEKSHRLNSEEQKNYSCYICKYKINSKAYFNDHNKRMHKAQRGLLMCIMQRKSKIFYKSPANDKASDDTWKFSWLQQILWSKTKYEEAYEKCPQGKKWNEGTQMDHTRTKIWMTIQLTMYYLT